MKTRILANNNKSFVKKIARRSIGSSRMRTVMSLLAVILAAALISGLSMFSLGLNEKTDRQLDTMQHVIYGNLTKEQCDRLRADERVDDSLMMKTGLASEMDGYTIQLSYTEQKKSSIAAADIKEGKYPEKMYEAAVDKAYMKRLGLPLQLGRKLTFRYYDGTTETFRISGFTDTGIKG
ncbi:MAG: ABC transporter permease, partial [Emergencia sp.]|nr:ABC transporter permease [Emergencia sp.]